VPVQFHSCRTSACEAEIAEDVVFDAVENEGGTRIGCAGLTTVVGRLVKALCGETDADEMIGAAATLAAPQAAVFSGEGMVVFAEGATPGGPTTI
jgi:hypothetical protein